MYYQLFSEQTNLDFESPIKGAINGILNSSSNYDKNLPAITDCTTENNPKSTSATTPVNHQKEIKRTRKYLAILIIVIVIILITTTTVYFLFESKEDVDIKLDVPVKEKKFQGTQSVRQSF